MPASQEAAAVSHTVTVELNPDAFARLEREAAAVGLSPAEFARRAVEDRLPRPPDESKRGSLRKLFGTFNSGNPKSADNEQIDADLAREYHLGADARAD